MERALHPERYIIGCADPSSPIDTRYRQFLEAYGCPILPMRYESAELGKTAINLFPRRAQVCHGQHPRRDLREDRRRLARDRSGLAAR